MSGKVTTHGGRNLLLLGVGSIAIALITTSLSLWIYYETGDIYIDRSRPGFLPEEEEVAESSDDDDGEYSLDTKGTLTAEVLDEYLENLETEINKLDAIEDTFGSAPLSDSSLGIQDTDTSSDTSE